MISALRRLGQEHKELKISQDNMALSCLKNTIYGM